MLSKDKLYYLASPYSKYPGGMEAAFKEISRIAGDFVKEGYKVYVPIAHSHPIAVYGGISLESHDIWLPFDEAIMNKCDGIIVVKMETWDKSYGINWEINWFKERGMEPIYHDV